MKFFSSVVTIASLYAVGRVRCPRALLWEKVMEDAIQNAHAKLRADEGWTGANDHNSGLGVYQTGSCGGGRPRVRAGWPRQGGVEYPS